LYTSLSYEYYGRFLSTNLQGSVESRLRFGEITMRLQFFTECASESIKKSFDEVVILRNLAANFLWISRCFRQLFAWHFHAGSNSVTA